MAPTFRLGRGKEIRTGKKSGLTEKREKTEASVNQICSPGERANQCSVSEMGAEGEEGGARLGGEPG